MKSLALTLVALLGLSVVAQANTQPAEPVEPKKEIIAEEEVNPSAPNAEEPAATK